MTEKIMRVRKPMMQTFLTAAKDSKNALTTYFNSGNPWIALSGLRALKDLRDLRADMFPDLETYPYCWRIDIVRSMSEVITIKKSSLFHPELK